MMPPTATPRPSRWPARSRRTPTTSTWTSPAPPPPDPKGINVPFIYTVAYAAYALKIAIAPEVPNNAGSLAPFRVTAPEDTIVNARRPHPVALRHVIGHLIPDTVFGAFDQILPDTVPAEGAGALCNFQVSLRAAARRGDARPRS